jgi:hypothetical protein
MGTVMSIDIFQASTDDKSACSLLIVLRSKNHDITHFIIDLTTYFIDHITLRRGDYITAFYDTSVPVALIFPPRYRAVVIAKNSRGSFVKVDYFNDALISSDNTLKLNISPRTQLLLPNNQNYLGNISEKNLAVVYSFTTKSIPALTTPSQVTVLCEHSMIP